MFVLGGIPLGRYRARRHCIAGDAVNSVLARNRLGQPVHTGLCRDVVGALIDVAGEPVITRNINDAPPTPLSHGRQHIVGDIEGGVEVVVYRILPVLDGNFLEALAQPTPDIVDCNVDGTESRFRLGDEAFDLFSVGHVCHDTDGARAHVDDLLDNRVHIAAVAVAIDHHCRALPSEKASNGAADVLPGTCDHGRAASQTSLHPFYPSIARISDLVICERLMQAIMRTPARMSPPLKK